MAGITAAIRGHGSTARISRYRLGWRVKRCCREVRLEKKGVPGTGAAFWTGKKKTGPWKLTVSPLKMDGWKMKFLLGRPTFRGYVSFREGNIHLYEKKSTAKCVDQRVESNQSHKPYIMGIKSPLSLSKALWKPAISEEGWAFRGSWGY